MGKKKDKEKLKEKRKKEKAHSPRPNTFNLGKTNLLLMLAGLVVIVIGFMLLGKGSITAAPILLVLGYCVIIPLAIVYRSKKKKAVEAAIEKRRDEQVGMGE
ncbi:MAG: hypothetical protein ACUVUU_10110 [bacterium]